MTTRRRIRIDIELPELTPTQADFLWNFLDDLAADLWDAYESDLLDLEYARSRPLEPDNDWTADEHDDLSDNPSRYPVSSDDTDLDF